MKTNDFFCRCLFLLFLVVALVVHGLLSSLSIRNEARKLYDAGRAVAHHCVFDVCSVPP